MAHAVHTDAIAKKPILLRLLFLFALLAFALQSYLIQTHIHGQPIQSGQGVHVSAPAAPDPLNSSDPASCPLCQEMMHAGVYVMPVIVSLALNLDWIVFPVPAAMPDPVLIQPGLNWQSRAPPRR